MKIILFVKVGTGVSLLCITVFFLRIRRIYQIYVLYDFMKLFEYACNDVANHTKEGTWIETVNLPFREPSTLSHFFSLFSSPLIALTSYNLTVISL